MMQWKLKLAVFVIVLHSALLNLNLALALVVNPMALENVKHSNEISTSSLTVLAVEIPGFKGNLNSESKVSLNTLLINKSETRLVTNEFTPAWTNLNVRGVIDGLSPSTIPTSFLLIGSSIIGLIGIARRSFFTG